MLALSSGTQAQLLDLSLDQLLEVEVIATPRFAADPREIPAAVTVLHRRDFERYGWRTLADALQAQPGYVVTTDYTYTYVATRGLATSGDYRARTQVMIDGIRLNENLYDSVNFDSGFPVDVAMIDRVEIIHGPSASVYGSAALFGVVNVVTRKGSELDGASVRASTGSGNASRAGVSWGGTVDGMDLALNLTGFDAKGRTGEFPERASAGLPWTTEGVDAENGTRIMARLSGSALRMAVYASQRHKYVPTGAYGSVFGDAGHRESDTNTLTEIGYRFDPTETLSWDNRLFHGYYSFQGRYPYDYDGLRVVNEDFGYGKWWGLESGFTWQPNPSHRVNGGVEYRDNYTQLQLNQDVDLGCFETGLPTYCSLIPYDSELLSIYLQDEISLPANFSATVGLRQDHQSDQEDRLNPRVGLSWQGAAGTIKYLQAAAYRNANAYERYYELPGYYEASPDLGPERMRSQELTWELPLGGRSQLVSSVYRYHLDGFIDLDDEGNYFNTQSYVTRGLEVGLSRQEPDGLAYSVSYSFQQSDTQIWPVETLLPAHMFKANLSAPLPVAGLVGGVEWQLYSKRSTVAAGEEIAGFGLLNVNLIYQPAASAWSLRAGIEDVLDKAWADPVARDDLMEIPRDRIRQLGRTWFAELNHQF